ncbi:hypothetical protein Tsubulata_037991, partial [Turnera subulata]
MKPSSYQPGKSLLMVLACLLSCASGIGLAMHSSSQKVAITCCSPIGTELSTFGLNSCYNHKWKNVTSYTYFMEHAMDSKDPVEEETAFYLYWICKFLVCNRSGKIQTSFQCVADAIFCANGPIALAPFLLGLAYNCIGKSVTYSFNENVSGPLWLVVLWAQSYFPSIAARRNIVEVPGSTLSTKIHSYGDYIVSTQVQDCKITFEDCLDYLCDNKRKRQGKEWNPFLERRFGPDWLRAFTLDSDRDHVDSAQLELSQKEYSDRKSTILQVRKVRWFPSSDPLFDTWWRCCWKDLTLNLKEAREHFVSMFRNGPKRSLITTEKRPAQRRREMLYKEEEAEVSIGSAEEQFEKPTADESSTEDKKAMIVLDDEEAPLSSRFVLRKHCDGLIQSSPIQQKQSAPVNIEQRKKLKMKEAVDSVYHHLKDASEIPLLADLKKEVANAEDRLTPLWYSMNSAKADGEAISKWLQCSTGEKEAIIVSDDEKAPLFSPFEQKQSAPMNIEERRKELKRFLEIPIEAAYEAKQFGDMEQALDAVYHHSEDEIEKSVLADIKKHLANAIPLWSSMDSVKADREAISKQKSEVSGTLEQEKLALKTEELKLAELQCEEDWLEKELDRVRSLKRSTNVQVDGKKKKVVELEDVEKIIEKSLDAAQKKEKVTRFQWDKETVGRNETFKFAR